MREKTTIEHNKLIEEKYANIAIEELKRFMHIMNKFCVSFYSNSVPKDYMVDL